MGRARCWVSSCLVLVALAAAAVRAASAADPPAPDSHPSLYSETLQHSYRVTLHFNFRNPEPDWVLDKLAWRRFQQVMFTRKHSGPGDPVMQCFEVTLDSTLASSGGLARALEEGEREWAAKKDSLGARLDSLEFSATPDTALEFRAPRSGLLSVPCVRFVMRERVLNKKVGRHDKWYLTQGFARTDPYQRDLVVICQLVWLLSKDQQPVPASARDLETLGTLLPVKR